MNESYFMLNKVCIGINTENKSDQCFDNANCNTCSVSFLPGFSESEKDDACEFKIDIKCCENTNFQSDKSVYVDVPLNKNFASVLTRRMYSEFWSKPEFNTDMAQNSDNIQDMLIKCDDSYIAVVAICNESFVSCIGASKCKGNLRFYLSLHYEGADYMNGTFAVIAEDINPYKAISKAYEFAYKKGYIKTPLRSQKELPPIYRKLGWCTWDAFYKQVNLSGIMEKLEEFKEKNIPVKWIVIDDGWSELTGKNLTELVSFCEDKDKFPGGLKKCIETIKNQYGIEKIGIWHSFVGCWNGINPDSELYQKNKENFVRTDDGCYIPKADKYFEFFDKWYSYLKAQGVDFVKIDTQGVPFKKLKGIEHFSRDYIEMHLAVEQAAKKHFDANVINCMGMSNMDMHFRPYSVLARNSDDFYPNKADGFAAHIITNAYNAVFQRELFFCDFDMWWTKHISAKQNSVLRAISGGPVYVSDKVGETDPEYIIPLIDDGGNVVMCDNIAVPTDDCLFKDCSSGVLKIYNTCGNDAVVAAFNLSNEVKNIKIDKKDFNGVGDFAAYSYFEKKWYKESVDFCLKPNEVEIVNFYKINNGKITVGDLDKYISIATERNRIMDM